MAPGSLDGCFCELCEDSTPDDQGGSRSPEFGARRGLQHARRFQSYGRWSYAGRAQGCTCINFRNAARWAAQGYVDDDYNAPILQAHSRLSTAGFGFSSSGPDIHRPPCAEPELLVSRRPQALRRTRRRPLHGRAHAARCMAATSAIMNLLTMLDERNLGQPSVHCAGFTPT